LIIVEEVLHAIGDIFDRERLSVTRFTVQDEGGSPDITAVHPILREVGHVGARK